MRDDKRDRGEVAVVNKEHLVVDLLGLAWSRETNQQSFSHACHVTFSHKTFGSDTIINNHRRFHRLPIKLISARMLTDNENANG